MVSQFQPMEPRTIAKYTSREKDLSRRQGQGTANEADGRMAQSSATGFPISTAERFSIQPGAAPTGATHVCSAHTAAWANGFAAWLSRLQNLAHTLGSPPRTRLGFIERQGPGRCIAYYTLVGEYNKCRCVGHPRH